MSFSTLPPEMDSLCFIKDSNKFTTSSYENNATSEDASNVGPVVVAIMTSLLSMLIVVGNGLIIVSVTVVKKLRQPANYLIVSLALSDFLVGFIVLPLAIVYETGEEWVFGSMMCDVHVSFDVICCTASIMNLCMISIDRYLMITKPMTYPKRRNGQLMAILIAIAWLIPCLVIIPALFGFTENVKDGPGWLHLKDILSEGGKLSPGPNSSYEHSALAAIDRNSTTFWDPTETSIRSSDWHFTLDLGRNYKMLKVGFENAGDNIHDVLQFNVEAGICENNAEVRIKKDFLVKPGTKVLQEGSIYNNNEVKYLKMSVNRTLDNNPPHIREFSVYGQKMQGKVCLISQEVWFTIYSTVGAFYLPLAVMLCMYWKIYLEASRFKARHKKRRPSFVESQDWSISPPGTPDHPVSEFSVPSTQSSLKRSILINNSFKKKKKKFTDDTVRGFNEQLLPDRYIKSNGIKVIINDSSEEDKNDHTNFEEDTVSSECEFLPNEKAENFEMEATCAVKSCMKTNAKGVNEINEDLNGNHQQFELQLSSLPNRTLKQTELCATNSPAPSTGVDNYCSVKPVSILRTRTWSENSMSQVEEFTNARRQRLSFNGVNKNEWRYPTILENAVLNLNHVDYPLNVDFDNEIQKSCRKVTYTRTPSIIEKSSDTTVTAGHKCKRSHRSVLSRLSAKSCCCRPVPQSHVTSGSLKEFPSQRRSSNETQTNSQQRNGQVNSDTNTSFRRTSVFNQIKRRMSMATSRDRMRNVKATRTLGIIVGAFTFCWLPFFIVTFLRPFICDNPESQDCIPNWLVRLVLWLGYLNSALNPLIYIGFSPDLRETFRFLLICKCTNVDRRLAQTELRQAIYREKRASITISRCEANESIM